MRSSESICAEYLSASLRLLESCAQIARLKHTPRKEAAVGRWREVGGRVPRGAYEGAVHVEGVLLDAGDALGEPPLLVVGAAVGEHPHRRRCCRHPRRLARWIWSASPAASGLGVGSSVGCPRGGWLGLDRCGCLCSAALFVARIFIYFLFPICFIYNGSIGMRRVDALVCRRLTGSPAQDSNS